MTAPSVVGHSQDGPQLTVNTFLKYPKMIPQLVLDMSRGQFIGDALLRTGPPASGGAVMWRDPTPLFANEDGEIVAEYGEIPGVEFPSMILHTKATTKRGLAVKVSQEMIERNDVGTVQDQMRMARNTMVRMFDRQFMSTVFDNTSIDSIESADGWYVGDASGITSIRADIAAASYEIMAASYGDDPDNKFGYEPDTLIISNLTASQWLDSDEVNKVFQASPLADESLRYTGKMPRKFFGLNVLRSWQVDDNVALLCQRGQVGFRSDERPLRGTPLYEDRPRETWRSDFTRMTVMAVDNPKSAIKINNINDSV